MTVVKTHQSFNSTIVNLGYAPSFAVFIPLLTPNSHAQLLIAIVYPQHSELWTHSHTQLAHTHAVATARISLQQRQLTHRPT